MFSNAALFAIVNQLTNNLGYDTKRIQFTKLMMDFNSYVSILSYLTYVCITLLPSNVETFNIMTSQNASWNLALYIYIHIQT